ncbi:HAD family hydrolase [Devosia sp. J2-20]|uniref:HAD family hydrolase n=1 Tax=Devosia sp. J2-20 TaxID=3026161 RepID=UPI00249CBD0C|nr:HAD family hydrolase [Devosia sp. J2-20]WDQ99480.1 HAD family hydrolase [Devosia sp. J2-20]
MSALPHPDRPQGPIDLIIFDCDGVLVDSEPLAMQVLVDAIAEQGITIAPEDAYRDFLGRSLSSISASLHDNHGAPLGPSALQSMRTNLYALYRQSLRANPGLPEVLDLLKTPCCVASSSMPERIHLSLELTGLLPHFAGHIYSASMVDNGKPAPDLFLYAASQMHVSPANCLVIEDSPAGITAAQRAGMRVLGYVGGSHATPGGLRPAITALHPDAIFDDMHALPDLVRSLRTEKRAR